MKLVGNRIYHVNLGFGEIVKQTNDKIQVRFDEIPHDEVFLIFPNKNFSTYFKFVDEDIHYEIHKEILNDDEFSNFKFWWYKNSIPKQVLDDNPSDDLQTFAIKFVLRIVLKQKNKNVYDFKYITKLLSSNRILKEKFVKNKKVNLTFFESLHKALFVISKSIYLLDKQKLCLMKYKKPKKNILGPLPQVSKQIKVNSELFDFERLLLFVYASLNSIKCINSQKHKSESVTITTINTEGQLISFNAFQCMKCGKFYSDIETINKDFRKLRYPLIRIVLDKEVELKLREKSELSIFGYNVRENVLTEQKRHELLAMILLNSILSKEKMISILQWLIKFNGKNSNCSEAIKKWKNDYEFVANYNLNKQRKILTKNVEIV